MSECKCGSENCCEEEQTVQEEKPMTADEIIAVCAHMSFNISSMLKGVDDILSESALFLSEKLLNRYDERKVGIQESDIEELKKRILG